MLDVRVAKLAVLAAVPTVIVGALLSRVVGDEFLLLASGGLLLVVGVRMLVPVRTRPDGPCHPRVDSTSLVVASVAVAGLVAGLLATGGGIVLVPLFIVAFGFTAARAAGTSLVVAAALTVPTLATHWLLGNIDWSIAARLRARHGAGLVRSGAPRHEAARPRSSGLRSVRSCWCSRSTS